MASEERTALLAQPSPLADASGSYGTKPAMEEAAEALELGPNGIWETAKERRRRQYGPSGAALVVSRALLRD